MKVLFLSATDQELNCLTQPPLPEDSIRTSEKSFTSFFKILGVGQYSIEANLPPLLSSLSPDIVVLFGSIGGLCSNLTSGTFFFPTSVLHVSDVNSTFFDLPANKSFFLPWFQDFTSESPFFGSMITVSDFINSSEQKVFLQKTFNVSAVDMETFFVVKICSLKSIPVLVIRIVIDCFSDVDLSISDYLNFEHDVFLRKKDLIAGIVTQISSRLLFNSHLK